MDTILVCRYTYWDDATQTEKLSQDYATFDAIKSLGKPVHSTARHVARLEVIGGFYVAAKAKPALEE